MGFRFLNILFFVVFHTGVFILIKNNNVLPYMVVVLPLFGDIRSLIPPFENAKTFEDDTPARHLSGWLVSI